MSVILLPLRLVSLKYKNPQRRKNNLWYASHRTERAIDRSEGVFVEYPVCEISVAVLVAVVKRGLFLLVFVVIYNRRSTFFFQ